MFSDEIRELEKQNEPEEVDVHPLSKWKRMLVFLGDFFINFVLSFILLAVAVVPLMSVFTNADQRGQELRDVERQRDDVLYGNKILFAKDNDKTSYSANLAYTFDRYLSYYVLDDSIPTEREEFKHDIENEVFYTYYNNIRNSLSTYTDMLKTQNQKYEYFIIESNTISLKDEYKEVLKYYYLPNESLGKEGTALYDNISNIFTILYKEIMTDISKNDLTYENVSFNAKHAELVALQNKDTWIYTACILIAFIHSWGIVYVLFPLIKRNGKTPTMMIVKAERIGVNNLSSLKWYDTFLVGLYSLVIDMAFLLFLPITYSAYSFIYAIRMPIIPYASIFGIVFIIVSLFVMIFNPMNKTLVDVLSRSVLIPRSDLEEVYRKKGYYD